MNSKRKGKEGELEWCKFCHERGFESVRRTAQSAVIPEKPLIVSGYLAFIRKSSGLRD